MVLFNHATREMTAKIVYYGPGLCGKTTNLMVIFDKLDPASKGKMLSLATKTDRTLFFDLLPVDIGKVGPFNLKIQLYTVPGQVFYNETRKLVLRGADAVVFVADSQPAMLDANRESFANLLENLEENQIDPNDTPVVIQFNKRDLPGVLPVEQLQESLGFEGYPYTEASALRGDGVMETFKLVSKITAKHLFTRLSGRSEPEKKKSKRAPAAGRATKPPEPAEPIPAVPPPAAEPFNEPDPFASIPGSSEYDKAEEVSLDQLLAEGRSRPATFAGVVAVPVDELTESAPQPEATGGEDQAGATAEPEPIAAVADAETSSAVLPHSRVSELEAEVNLLRQKLEMKQSALEMVLRDLDELRTRVNAELDA